MDKTNKVLIQFNVKNGQYAVHNGTSFVVSPLTWLNSFSKDKNMESNVIYGDGEGQLELINDKGFTGILGLTAPDLEYNKALGFMETLSDGTAEVQQFAAKEHCIYFETQYTGKDGVIKVKKSWVFGVTAEVPSESFEQNTDSTNQSNVEYNITIKGVNLKAATGDDDYVDENGNTKKIYILSKVPSDTGYSTFENTVPTPRVSA